MAYRYSWLAADALVAAAMARLNKLVTQSVDGISWQLILVGAAVLAAIVTWSLVSYGLGGRWVLAINAAVVGVVGGATATGFTLPAFRAGHSSVLEHPGAQFRLLPTVYHRPKAKRPSS